MNVIPSARAAARPLLLLLASASANASGDSKYALRDARLEPAVTKPAYAIRAARFAPVASPGDAVFSLAPATKGVAACAAPGDSMFADGFE